MICIPNVFTHVKVLSKVQRKESYLVIKSKIVDHISRPHHVLSPIFPQFCCPPMNCSKFWRKDKSDARLRYQWYHHLWTYGGMLISLGKGDQGWWCYELLVWIKWWNSRVELDKEFSLLTYSIVLFLWFCYMCVGRFSDVTSLYCM